jgi:hypothetical protein
MTFPTRPSPIAATPALDAVALHLIRAIVRAAQAGRSTHLEELAQEIGVRKADCRRALTTLHRQGYVDVLRMRPTLEGFALGAGLERASLRAPRAPELRLGGLPADLLAQVGGAPAAELVPQAIGRVAANQTARPPGGPRTSEPPPSSRAA